MNMIFIRNTTILYLIFFFIDNLHPKNGYIWTRIVKHSAKIDIQVFVFAFCIKNNLSIIVKNRIVIIIYLMP